MKRTGRWLAYIRRAQGYISILNSAMILIILLKTFGVSLNWYWYPVIIPVALVGFLVVGFLDTKLGIRRMEMLDNEMNHPTWLEIRDNVRKLVGRERD